jgi:hypothetical protein
MTEPSTPFLRHAACVLLVSAATLGGCASTTPTFDASFGDGMRSLMAQQIRHPEAPDANRQRNADGIDGRSARETMERYVKGSIEPARTAPNFQLGAGGDQGTGR